MQNGVRQRHDAFIERLNTLNVRFGMFSEIAAGATAAVCYRRSLPESFKLIAQRSGKAGVMVLIAGGDVVRFAPALNVSDGEIATGFDCLPRVRTPQDGRQASCGDSSCRCA